MRQPASLTAGSRDASLTGDQSAAQNTDRELWRERADDYYAPSIHVTQGGAIGMNVGGRVIVKPIREWHRLAAVNTAMLAALQECADDLAAELEDRYSAREIYRGELRRYERDMGPVLRARTAIALSDHQNAPTDDATGQRSGLSP